MRSTAEAGPPPERERSPSGHHSPCHGPATDARRDTGSRRARRRSVRRAHATRRGSSRGPRRGTLRAPLGTRRVPPGRPSAVVRSPSTASRKGVSRGRSGWQADPRSRRGNRPGVAGARSSVRDPPAPRRIQSAVVHGSPSAAVVDRFVEWHGLLGERERQTRYSSTLFSSSSIPRPGPSGGEIVPPSWT